MIEGTLRERLLAAIATGAPLDDAEFNSLARAVFAHQYACNRPLRLFCDRRGASPDSIAHWTEVPAVPVDAFKAAPLVCGSPADAAAVFRTSGTTLGAARRGEHFFPELGLYDAGLAASFAAHLLPDGARPPILSLVPSATEAPDSSLAHMVAEVTRRFGGGRSSGPFIRGGEGVDRSGLEAVLRYAERSGELVCLLGTSFALVEWLDSLAATGSAFRLPPRSRVMDTGGFKGRSRELKRAELFAVIGDRLGVPPAWCVNEYGMTEMSSQFYDGVAGKADPDSEARWHRGPPWVRTRAVDPETLALLPDGEPGVLRHWDLANLHSVMAIQTADLGVVGPNGFRLRGRARGAEGRGCSLAAAELLAALRSTRGA